MTIFVQPMQPPLEQPLRGRPTGPIYVTLVESTLFDGTHDPSGLEQKKVEIFFQDLYGPLYCVQTSNQKWYKSTTKI